MSDCKSTIEHVIGPHFGLLFDFCRDADLTCPETGGTLRMTGQILGHYRILEKIGAGGMGEVYEAEHLEQGRYLALKVLSRALDSPGDRDRFLREGQLAAAISTA